jgi:hypothetical protein
MSSKYKFGERTGAYFVSFATVNWIVVFTRDAYFRNIIESLDFRRKIKQWEFTHIALCQAIFNYYFVPEMAILRD